MSKIVPISFHAVFQFHYGTIKRMSVSLRYRPLAAFQFHYGTIKSISLNVFSMNAITFQFHYGTIKR